MEEIESFSKTHPRKTIVASTGTSIFLMVLIMMGIYIAFDGKIPQTIKLPVSFPVVTTPTQPKPPISVEPEPSSYTAPTSYTQEPVSYP